QLIAKMMGKELAELESLPKRAAAATTKPSQRQIFVEARQLGRKRSIAPLDLEIAEGELVSLAGLLGSGRTETARLLFGIDQADSGEIRVGGRKASVTSPSAALVHRFGFCPEDRK